MGPFPMTHRLRPSPTKPRWARMASSSWNSAILGQMRLDRLFRIMGFAAVAKHRSKNVTLFRQGDINFVLNAEPRILRCRIC